jgi:hypothetical protein
VSIAALEDIFLFLDSGTDAATALAPYRTRIADYRARYGVHAD